MSVRLPARPAGSGLAHRTPHRRILAALAAAIATCLAAAGSVHAAGSVVDVIVVDRATGQELPLYLHHGEYWVAGQPHATYGIGLRNQQSQRVMAVLSVDGVNAVTGETASAHQNGYVLGPWQQAQINGWRKNLGEIAAFYFTTPRHSYASRTGRPDDVGVIGVAVFREKLRPVLVPRPLPQHPPHADAQLHSPSPPYGRSGSMAESPAAAGATADTDGSGKASRHATTAAAPSPALGTGHGAREQDQASSTSFVRASSIPAEIIRIRYDSMANLQARGIVPRAQPPKPPVQPDPFPADRGFVPDPPR